MDGGIPLAPAGSTFLDGGSDYNLASLLLSSAGLLLSLFSLIVAWCQFSKAATAAVAAKDAVTSLVEQLGTLEVVELLDHITRHVDTMLNEVRPDRQAWRIRMDVVVVFAAKADGLRGAGVDMQIANIASDIRTSVSQSAGRDFAALLPKLREQLRHLLAAVTQESQRLKKTVRQEKVNAHTRRI